MKNKSNKKRKWLTFVSMLMLCAVSVLCTTTVKAADNVEVTGVGIFDQTPNKGIHTWDSGSKLIQVTFNEEFWNADKATTDGGKNGNWLEWEPSVNMNLLINGKTPTDWIYDNGDASWGSVCLYVKESSTLGQYLEIHLKDYPGLPSVDTDSTITLKAGFAGVLTEDVTFKYNANNNVPYEKEIVVEDDVFEMTKGGSIRVAEPYGLRFQVKMSPNVKENITNNNGKVGMLIFPADYLVNSGVSGDVYYDSVEALAATTNTNHRIKLDLTSKLYEEDGYWNGNGVIVKIKDKNMTREFVGIAYYEVNGTTVWADTSKIADTTRSASQVALLARGDSTGEYSEKAEELLLNYIDYTRFEDLSALKLNALPLYVDNGSEVAKSYWTAEYTEKGVKIWANVIDSNISIDADAMYLSDNVEFQIQAVENHLQTDGYTVNMLCNVEGNNWLRRWSTGTGWVNEEVTVDLTSENDSVYYLYEQTATGYKVEFFMSYDMLNVTAEEAMGNVRILPMLRNRTNSYFNSYSPLDLFGSHHDYPSTWFVLDENNQFTRKDSERFTLKSVSEESENMISTLAEISSDYGIYTAEFGAPIFDVNSIWGLDGLARELYGTDYVRGPKTGGQTVTIEKSGYVIVLCSRANTAMLEQLAQDNWTLLTDKAKCAISVTANTNKSFQYLNAYYGKYFEAGESFTVSGEYAVVFAKAAETPEDFTWKTTSAYISFEDVHDEYYSAEKNIFNACPGIAVSNGGRLFATYVTGGTFEPDGENSNVVVYSDDNGTTWNKAFVIDSWLNQEIGGDKENVVLEADLRVDSSTNKLYVMYNYRMNKDGDHVMNTSPWLFTVDNIDKDITEWDVSEQIQTGLEGHVRNTFTILSDGRFAIIPNNCLNSEPNIIYFSSDKGKTWIPGGEVYVPQALNYDEPVLVEKTDGSLWVMFRTTRGAIYESFSYDGGATWTIAQRTDIQNPSSRFNIARLASGNLVMIYNDSTSGRLGMMAAVSTDDGKTWTNKLCLYDGHSSYPAIAVRNENGEDRVHVIFDDGRYYGTNWRANEDNTVQYYSSIYHYSFTESELLAGGDSNDNELELLALGDSYTDYYWGGFKNSFGTYGGETIGISGTQVADWNNDDKISEVVAKNPQRIFINLGINDLRRGSTGANVGQELVAYLEVLKQNLPDTDIYYNMIVYTPNTSDIYGQISISNEIVASYIDENADDNVHKIDVREKLMIKGEVDAAKFSDGLHMWAEGYNILCEAIKDATGIGIPISELNTITCAQKKVYFDFDSVDVEYVSLGTIGGTNTSTFNAYIANDGDSLYFKATTSDTLDATLNEGINFFVHFGSQAYRSRTENTYSFLLYANGGVATGKELNYPNGNTSSALALDNVFRRMRVEGGMTTLYGVLPFASLEGIDTSKISVCMVSNKGTAYDTWTYKATTPNRFQALDYPVLHNDNTISKDLTRSEFQMLVEASSAYCADKPVFDNMASISTTGTMRILNEGDVMFADRNYVFDKDMPDFLFDMKYAYNKMAEGNFTVTEAGYVILLLPGGSTYSTIRTYAEGQGFVKILSDWNKTGALIDTLNYYIKWCAVGESYNMLKWNIAISEQQEYVSLGTIGGTNTSTFNTYMLNENGTLYFKAETSDTLDDTLDEGINFFVHFGSQAYTSRTENTYSFLLYANGGAATGKELNYPNAATSSALGLSGVYRKMVVKDGNTTLYGAWPLASIEGVDTSKISVCMTSVKGSGYDTWAYKNQTPNRFKPVYYPVLHSDNTLSKDLTTAEFESLVGATAAYQTDKPLFENIATISTTGTLKTVELDALLFSDRTTQNFVFDADIPDFLFGMQYAYNGISAGNFTVKTAGYVILVLPGGTSYSTVRTTAEGKGFVKILEDWNKTGKLTDSLNYYVKWCEAGETYNFGKWNIAIGK